MKNQSSISPLLAGEGLPDFNNITFQEVESSIPVLLNQLNNEFSLLEADLENKLRAKQILKWDQVLKPLNKIEERLRWSWGTVSHLNGVSNTSELRKAYASQQSQIIRFSNRLGQSNILFKSLSTIAEKSKDNLDKAQVRILQSQLLSMKTRGVGLEGKDQKDFNKNSERLAELSTLFSNNLLDATNQWNILLTDLEEVEGLPKRNLRAMSQAAKESNSSALRDEGEGSHEEGPWLLGLDIPTYIPFMTYAKNRSLRETLYKAFISRASSGNLSNEEVINEILILKKEQSKLLGFDNWAQVSLSNKMAKDVQQVEKLLEEIREAAIISATKELERLQDFAKKTTGNYNLKLAQWDISYWEEKFRESLFDLNQEALREWFPLPQVLAGLFKVCERLFGITINPSKKNYPVWHEDVQLFDVHDTDGSHIASFYLDPYSRPSSKRGGAWMDECLTKTTKDNGDIVLPVAYLICNQTPPTADTPSLMSFEEVKTLFHEFGHGLQHMLTTVEYPQAAGINNIEWDAVELPSQFMENWCLDKQTMKDIANHWITNESLPDDDFLKLLQNQKFNSGLSTLRQIHFALTDLKLHSIWDKDLGVSPDELRREISKYTCVMTPIPEDKFLCSFSHIFAGGYSAGYYSYKWAEVLSADAFSSFEEAGLKNEEKVKEIGNHFRETILSLGGSRHPAEIYELFRGRQATTEALIRHSGLNHRSS